MRTDIYEVMHMTTKDAKVNLTALAKQYNCDPRTVKKYYYARDADLTKRKQRVIKHIYDGYEELILRKAFVDKAPASEIYKLLVKKYGYKGSYSTIKRFIRSHKEYKQQDATIHFETAKGEQCQIDWKESLKLINNFGEVFEINIFLAILGYSRLKYIELTLDKTQSTLFRCLSNTMKYFKGTPKELLFDNMKTVVDQSRTQFKEPVYNSTFLAFAKDAGFIAKSCIAFRPATKGKVETVARIMNRLKAYNNEFKTLDDLKSIVNNLLYEINSETHATTGEKPFKRYEKEKEYLNPEPNYEILEAYYQTKPLVRKVPKDCLISYQNNKYSVPPTYVGKIVTLQIEDSNLFIYYNNNFVCRHNISNKKINYEKDHYIAIAQNSIHNTELIETICSNNLDLYDKLGD